MTLQNINTPNLEFTIRDDGIYEITMKADTRDAVDEWLAVIRDIWTHHRETGTTFKVLSVSIDAENIPLKYSLMKGQQMYKEFGVVPDGRAAYVLKNKGIMMSLLESFMRMMRLTPVEMRYYDETERDEAITWLKS